MNYWRRLNGERLHDPIEEIVEATIREEAQQKHKLKVCIGTDSQVRAGIIEYATVIVFLREKSGGFMLIQNDSQKANISLKERLLTEVAKSIDVAYRVCKILDAHKVDMEVHADINTNPNFKSNASLHEAMGYILSMGFVFKAKPDAFASTSCANKVV